MLIAKPTAAFLLWFSVFVPRLGAIETPSSMSECRFPECAISAVQNGAIASSIANDRGILLGGFSDLYRAESDPLGEFWIVTDRGPNAQVVVEGDGNGDGSEKRRTFPIPEYAPMILQVKVNGGELQLLQAISLVGQSGRPISGRPNLAQLDDGGYDFAGQKPAPFSPSGIDPEGLVRTAEGEFWLAEEYRPSLLKVDAQGKVLKRFIPKCQSLAGADYAVAAVLPEIYAKRQDNRGFEGLAMSGEGQTLYAAMQSPLGNPTAKLGMQSRIARVLAFDIRTERPIAEYAYQFDQAEEFNAGSEPNEMKIGGVVISSSGKMLVLERDDKVAKIYRVDLDAATNLLQSPYHQAADNVALETAPDLGSLGVRPLPQVQRHAGEVGGPGHHRSANDGRRQR
jgi:hypothetical protein